MILDVIQDGVNNMGNKDVTHYFAESRYQYANYFDEETQLLLG